MLRDARLVTRHIDLDSKRTTIALEGVFWRHIDHLAALASITWQQWTVAALKGRDGIGKARRLRVVVLLAAECGGRP